MVKSARHPALSDLYHDDETAWLEAMAQLAAEGRASDLDLAHLGEYLQDMARRDKREVLSRLTVLLLHLLKWEYQPDHRTPSWEATIATQRDELRDLLESRTLRNYAGEILATAYGRAVKRAAIETGLPERTFPSPCPFELDGVMGKV